MIDWREKFELEKGYSDESDYPESEFVLWLREKLDEKENSNKKGMFELLENVQNFLNLIKEYIVFCNGPIKQPEIFYFKLGQKFSDIEYRFPFCVEHLNKLPNRSRAAGYFGEKDFMRACSPQTPATAFIPVAEQTGYSADFR